jgi:DEAD/DEAH box helicase domain-containing protein
MTINEFIDAISKDGSTGANILEHRYMPSVEPLFAPISLNAAVKQSLSEKGINELYSHQAEAINLIRQGHNVITMTPTASGKSLIYNIPVIESILANPNDRALYIFPLKGLEHDQMKNLNTLIESCLGSFSSEVPYRLPAGVVYDGDTTAYHRKKIRENLPNVIFTNPDMIHLAFNTFHKKWENFFRNLKYVIIDEIHTYRGVFGSHVCHVIRRLRRICNYWGSKPQFIVSSATIANPLELAATLTGCEFSLVSSSGAPQSGKHFIFLSPQDSPYTEATRIFLKSISFGFRTILFTKARKITELIYRWSVERAPLSAHKIRPYRAGFLPSERREIEQKLFSGELSGVISTSALELGVDIGGLDVCILCGYPGSISSTWQRAGRVGRKDKESLIIMIPMKDALDHYIVSHPSIFFDKSHEASVCDPDNEKILKQHLLCAADELSLKPDDISYPIGAFHDVIAGLAADGVLKKSKTGGFYSRIRRPQHSVGIRSIGRPLKLKAEDGRIIGELDGKRIYRDGFPGAIYMHLGKQYEILSLDIYNHTAFCREVEAGYYTHAISDEHIEINGVPEKKPSGLSGGIDLYSGKITITYHVVGYDKKSLFDGTRISRQAVEMPKYVFESEGIWMLISKSLAKEITEKGFDLPGTLHAAEHVTISALPLFALCDKADIGGLSYPLYPESDTPAIFIYDGYEGGIGLAKRTLYCPPEWIKTAIAILKACDCEDGCPLCVQDSQCGSANKPLDKKGALYLLDSLL